jgi:hypothetical protein
MPSTTRTTPISGEGAFMRGFMASVAYVASAVARLIALEVIKTLRPARRHRANVTVMRIKAVVDMAVKAPRAVKPGASSKKQAADEPIRPIVTVRSTVIRSIVEVPVRTHRSRPDVYADGNLGSRHRCTAQKGDCENR